MSVIEHILRIIAPHECFGCGVEGHLLCAVCVKRLPPPHEIARPQGVNTIYAVTGYQGVAKTVIHALKFERASAAAEDIARCIALHIVPSSIGAVTHIPTAPIRVRQRGYDQSRLIARAVARHMAVPYIPLLIRYGNQRQVGSGRAARRQQLHHAFRFRQGIKLPNGPILLIDDVLTTGATIQAAARVLHTAGVQQVNAAVFAVAETSQPSLKLV